MHLDRTTTPGWRNTENHPHPRMDAIAAWPPAPSSPHFFPAPHSIDLTLSLLSVAGGSCTVTPSACLAWHRDAQLSSSLDDCPDWLLLPCWLSGCWSAPHTRCPCSSPGTPRSGTPPARTQREGAQKVKFKHKGTRCLNYSPAVRSSPEKPERGKNQLEFNGHFLSKVNLTEARILTANTDCFLVIELLCVEDRGKKCKDHQ